MKKYIVLASLFASSLAYSAHAQTSPKTDVSKVTERSSLAIGKPNPLANISLEDVVTGKVISMKEMIKPSGTLVIFTCNTCPYVVKAQARTAEVLKDAETLGIGVILLNSNEAQRADVDSKDAMKKYAAAHKYSNYFIDSKSAMADAFGATKTPEVFLFDPQGNLAYKGAMDDNPASPSEAKQIYLKNAMTDLVSGGQIEPNTTKSIGCSIKRAGK